VVLRLRTRAAPSQTLRKNATMLQILVIEDEADIAETMVMLLETEGYSASYVANGEAALSRLARSDLPNVILLDLTMPVMNGSDFRRRQLADPRIAPIPVIVLTATPTVGDRDELKAHAILTKPVGVTELLDTIKRAALLRA
jgi:CheY-like chemotaxis protein